ncbi:hypothetical protein [Acidithiobacillus sp.]|uniref:hypothetical protein n=1 Tax=Acidithiobacillus sp. TaxID=1872118 RepID=UPI0025BC0619|nr:hypothetical protein [Acidithiobacillus sp.]
MTAEDMRFDSQLLKQHGSDHTLLDDCDKVLPILSFGSARRQRWLQSVPCALALLCAGFTMVHDWRWGLALLAVLLAWIVWRCPLRQRVGQAVPEAILIGIESDLQVQMDDGSVVHIQPRDRPFLHPRLGVIPLQGSDGRRHVLIGLFTTDDDLWRRWRLRLRQEWNAAPDPADPAG